MIAEVEAEVFGGQDLEEGFEIWPCNVKTVDLFIGLRTQWRVIAGFAGERYQGLDYPAVESYLRTMKIKRQKRVMKELQIMERAALEEMRGE